MLLVFNDIFKVQIFTYFYINLSKPYSLLISFLMQWFPNIYIMYLKISCHSVWEPLY